MRRNTDFARRRRRFRAVAGSLSTVGAMHGPSYAVVQAFHAQSVWPVLARWCGMACARYRGASMDGPRFDSLIKTLVTPGTRHGLVCLQAAVPLAGGLLPVLDPAVDGKVGKGGRAAKTARATTATRAAEARARVRATAVG